MCFVQQSIRWVGEAAEITVHERLFGVVDLRRVDEVESLIDSAVLIGLVCPGNHRQNVSQYAIMAIVYGGYSWSVYDE
ncbi:MAG: hypothetical protein BWY82_02800 [Verrucomicrobia bacterium ADurb.Bin474]|nr:MAG: hypothetical protein BWY82_02800 [Verrucomicrobia bacterium ADurb.Bin474]